MIREFIDMERKRRFPGLTGRLFLCAVIIISSVALGNQADTQSGQPTRYELKLEDGNIETLILQNGNQKKTFDKPGKSIMLKSGIYQVFRLQLKGGFTYNPYGNTIRLGPIQIRPGEPAVLKAGGPLEQHIKVQRKGQLLTMDYRLIGAAGESYRNDRRHPPIFTIYKGDKKITSGKFQFG